MADLANRYATALFELAKESGNLEAFLTQSQFLCTCLEHDGALGILAHPLIPANEKTAFIDKAFASNVSPDMIGFMKLTVAKSREAFLLNAFKQLVAMIRKHQNYTTARVVSAVSLSESQLTQLTNAISQRLGKNVEINLVIDPSQISGISIHVDGYFLDRTVKSMLKNMKESLSAI